MASPCINIACGTQGIAEMQPWISEKTVQWAWIRVVIWGPNGAAVLKDLFLHINNEKCPPVTRARLSREYNAVIKDFLSSAGEGQHTFHAELEVVKKSEVTVEKLLERCSKYFLTDVHADCSAQWLIQQYDRSLQKIRVQQQGGSGGEAIDGSAGGPVRPGHESKERFGSGRDALRAVGDPRGPWNWVLLGSNPDTMPLLKGGSGSVIEMAEYIAGHQDAVMFGLLRMNFGQARWCRTKYVFVHVTGVKAPNKVRRGRQNAVKAKMQEMLKKFAAFSTSLEIDNAAELTVEYVIQQVRKAGHVDDAVLDGDSANKSAFTVEQFREALAEEQRGAETGEDAIADTGEVDRCPGRNFTLQETLKLMHGSPPGIYNWALFGANEEWIGTAAKDARSRSRSVSRAPSPSAHAALSASAATVASPRGPRGPSHRATLAGLSPSPAHVSDDASPNARESQRRHTFPSATLLEVPKATKCGEGGYQSETRRISITIPSMPDQNA